MTGTDPQPPARHRPKPAGTAAGAPVPRPGPPSPHPAVDEQVSPSPGVHPSDDRHPAAAAPAKHLPTRLDVAPRSDVLPTLTSDETDVGWGDWREERDGNERLLREVPPHHGTY